MGIRYSALPGTPRSWRRRSTSSCRKKWSNLRGVSVVSFGVSSVSANPEDEKTIKELQKNAVFATRPCGGPSRRRAGFGYEIGRQRGRGRVYGVCRDEHGAENTGWMNAQSLFSMGAQQPAQQQQQQQQQTPPAAGHARAARSTRQVLHGVRRARPQAAAGWSCGQCGTVNKGKFCMECAAPKPQGVPQYNATSAAGSRGPVEAAKFCPECGDR
jgi:membrane protease subunit (stomatin/prohibitin family)